MVKTKLGDRYDANIKTGRDLGEQAGLGFHWSFVCKGPDGKVKWVEEGMNLIPDAEINRFLDYWLNGLTQISTLYIGLTNSTPSPAPTDTYQTHPGWTENIAYSQGTRPQWTKGSAANKQVTNATSVDFSINASTTVGGGFLASDNTKGDSSAGPVLVSVRAFTGGDKVLGNGDTLQVTVTITGSSS